ncbi:aldose epimerase family protein [Treponema primitia]|uniref:aldose epimerase family protein n=1 Tax=Treponema primitia TaxID=88058 RepID=UPI0002555780|nr:aldose epimerase family protein [Treponema primitia]
MKISKKTFGVLASGKKVRLYTLKAGDLSLSISTLGATWTSLLVPSSKKRTDDVLLGFPTLAGYDTPKNYVGATIGRFGNRIGGARFALNGKTYDLYKNDGKHSLHGGWRGFDKFLWKAEAYEEQDGVFVRFELESPDGDEGYPGNLKAVVSYGLTKSHELVADYQAQVDAQCPVNLTNHAYFNLAGEGRGDILGHELQIHGASYVDVDKNLIPTGKLLPVQSAGTTGAFDFTARKPIGRDFKGTLGTNGTDGPGYDHCFVLDGDPGKLRPCADVFEPLSGRSMRVFTTQPAVQFYTGNFLDGLVGKEGSVYNRHTGFCLETQHLPDSPNHGEFPSCIFGPGRDYHERSIFSFDW